MYRVSSEDKYEFLHKYNLREIGVNDGFELELIYATKVNFTGNVLYENPVCMLRKGTFNKLIKANQELMNMGLKIKIWDAFRFYKYQEKMWEVVHNDRFVADPKGKMCSHCKGSAVDVTLVTLDGKPVKMPTEFDCFTIESSRSYYDQLEEEVRENVLILENVMIKYGFIPYEFEWWHFEDSDDYDIIYNYF